MGASREIANTRPHFLETWDYINCKGCREQAKILRSLPAAFARDRPIIQDVGACIGMLPSVMSD